MKATQKKLIIRYVFRLVFTFYLLSSTNAAPIVRPNQASIIDPRPTDCLERPPFYTDVQTSISCKNRWSESFSNRSAIATAVVGTTLTAAGIGAVGIAPSDGPTVTNMINGQEVVAPFEALEIADQIGGTAAGIVTVFQVVAVEAGVVGAGIIIYFGVEAYRNWKNSHTSTQQEDITEEDRQVRYEINDLDGFSCSGDTRLEDHDQVNLKAIVQSCHLESGKEYWVTLKNKGKIILREKKVIIP